LERAVAVSWWSELQGIDFAQLIFTKLPWYPAMQQAIVTCFVRRISPS